MSSNITENHNNMDFENKIRLLEQIQIAEPPPFLYTRIQQKIQNQKEIMFSGRMVWGISFCLMLVMAINFVYIIKQDRIVKTENNIAKEMNLIPNNELYQ